MEKYILFGAGLYGKKAIELLGRDRIEVILDNDSYKWGTSVYGLRIYRPEEKRELMKSYPVVVSVSPKYEREVVQQLKNWNTRVIKTLPEIQTVFRKRKIEARTDYIKIYNKAVQWIKNSTIDEHAIICTTDKRKGYPEVTGYYIPTLLQWGYRDLAVSYARWLCEIQKEDGSWYDTDDTAPYIFDTAQILKGLIAVREIYPTVDRHIEAGCNWILNNMEDCGRLVTPSKEAWGDNGMCSELIHIYCLSPLVQAADVLDSPRYREAAYRILDYYKKQHYDEIMNFSLLSHFYAYVIEGLLDMGEEEMALEAMKEVAVLQKDSGAVPAFKDVDWVCSTGLFQFALVWFRLGDIERGNRAFEYACKLQNESGGWYGSYVSEENGTENNIYFPDSEISWAVKYFLDALYYKNIAEFNLWSESFLSSIDKEDERYQVIRKIVAQEHISRGRELRVIDVGCGKGRYLNGLIEDESENQYYALDLSTAVMEYITVENIEKKQGSVTNIGYPDDFFDVAYTCVALEHAIDITNAIKELARVTKPGGKIIIIDKNKAELGRMEICPWEVWFDAREVKELLSDYCSDVIVIEGINYEEKKEDKLFLAWIGTVDKEK